MSNRKRKYGLMHFLLDVLLTIVTGGLWLLFKLFQYFHRRTA
jgi:hypothetical protein